MKLPITNHEERDKYYLFYEGNELRFPHDQPFIRLADEVLELLSNDRGSNKIFDNARLNSTLRQLVFLILRKGYSHPLDHLEQIVFMHPVVQEAMREQCVYAGKKSLTEEESLRLSCINNFMDEALGRKWCETIEGTQAFKRRQEFNEKYKAELKKEISPESKAKIDSVLKACLSPEAMEKTRIRSEKLKNMYSFDSVYNSLKAAIEARE